MEGSPREVFDSNRFRRGGGRGRYKQIYLFAILQGAKSIEIEF